MKKKQAKKLFTKYVNNECSPEELELLHRFLNSYQDKNQVWPESEYGIEEDFKRKMWQQIQSKVNNDKKEKTYPVSFYIKYAAVFLVFIGIAFLYQKHSNNQGKGDLLIDENMVTVELDGDVTKKIDTDGANSLVDTNGKVIGTQKGNQLIYHTNEKLQKLVYNEIFVPNGKRFDLVLSDGTVVQLNSGTSLRFPVRFLTGRDRQVFLKGEAYFEVSKDAKHPFLVQTDNIGVKVLGTHFNVSSYKNANTFTVLAEGSVAVFKKDGPDSKGPSKIINPGQKASWSEQNIEVDNVNVDDYLGWREGKLIFNDESFTNLIEKIERKYNVTIENRYMRLNDFRFNGKFGEETIVDLLNTFKAGAGFEYQIVDNEIIITQPDTGDR